MPFPSNNSFMIIAPKEKVTFFKDIIKILDSPGITKDEYEKANMNNLAETTPTSDIEYGENSIKLIHSVYVPCSEIIRTFLTAENRIDNKDLFCPLPTTNGILIIGQKENIKKYLSLFKNIDIPNVSK